MRKKIRAIALAGGGPAAGLHIGALQALEEAEIDFDVFALSCIGAWVGIVYNTRTGPRRASQTLDFFKTHCFRDDRSYEWFPLNRGFATDYKQLLNAWAAFPFSKDRKWEDLVVPQDIAEGMQRTAQLFADPSRWTNQEFNYWMLNDVLAVNPVVRYMTSLMFRSDINGLSKIFYEKSKVLDEVFREPLSAERMPEIYHNAWRVPEQGAPGGIQIFHNKREKSQDGKVSYLEITPQSLCACSALPFIEESVQIDGHEYTEGALVDTVNFSDILRDNPKIDEVWVSRIVDSKQVASPHNLGGALANLPMQFAAEVGENDVKLFRQHLLNQTRMQPRVVEIPINPQTRVSFEWKQSNLETGRKEGYAAVKKLLAFDEQLREATLG